MAGFMKRRKSMRPLRANATTALAVPKLLCSLLVAMALTGGRPAAISAGMVSNPPPPAMASMRPATKATAISRAIVSVASSIGVFRAQGWAL